MADTTYAILVKYDDSAVKKSAGSMDQLAKSAGVAGRNVQGVGSMLAGVGGLVAGGLALRAAKSTFIDFNNSIEQSTISLSAQKQMMLGGGWGGAMREATGLFASYQDVAKRSVGTTQDFLEMHQGISASAYRAGLGLEQLKQMTVGATIAASVLGERADVTALDMKQMLAGNVGARDRVAQILLASQGVSQDAFNNQFSQKQRNQTILAALNAPAIKNAAKAMEGSFAGVTSTFQDNLQIIGARVGLPLFKAITAEVKSWNAWIERNPQKIALFAKEFGAALRGGFETAKRVGSFLFEHRELLLTVAKAILISKGIGFAGQVLAGPFASLANFAGGINGAGVAAKGFAGTMTSVSSRIVGAAGALGAAFVGLQLVIGVLEAQQERRISNMTSAASIRGFIGERFGGEAGREAFNRGGAGDIAAARFAVKLAREQGILGEKGGRATISQDAIERNLYGTAGLPDWVKEQMGGRAGEVEDIAKGIQRAFMLVDQEDRRQQAETLRFVGQGLIAALDAHLAKYAGPIDALTGLINMGIGAFGKAAEALPGVNTPGAGTTVQLTQNIEVRTDDADRMAYHIIGMVDDALRHPSVRRSGRRD